MNIYVTTINLKMRHEFEREEAEAYGWVEKKSRNEVIMLKY